MTRGLGAGGMGGSGMGEMGGMGGMGGFSFNAHNPMDIFNQFFGNDSSSSGGFRNTTSFTTSSSFGGGVNFSMSSNIINNSRMTTNVVSIHKLAPKQSMAKLSGLKLLPKMVKLLLKNGLMVSYRRM